MSRITTPIGMEELREFFGFELWEDILECKCKEGGRDPAEGLDCWGIPCVLYARCGVSLPDYAGCTAKDIPERWEKPSLESFIVVPLPSQPLDLIRIGEKHIGTSVGNFRYLHIRENHTAEVRNYWDVSRITKGVLRHRKFAR